MRLNLDVKYSLQLASSGDFKDQATVIGNADIEDIDMSGVHTTFGVSFLFGR